MGITGEKTLLRTMVEQDKRMLTDLFEDPRIVRVTGGYHRPVSLRQQIWRFYAGSDRAGSLYRIIADREDPRTGMGIVMLAHVDREERSAEIHIKLLEAYQGKGYGPDAIRALVGHGFKSLQLDHICADILEENLASRRAFEKCGFVQEEVRRSNRGGGGQDRNVCVYKIHGPAFEGKRAEIFADQGFPFSVSHARIGTIKENNHKPFM